MNCDLNSNYFFHLFYEAFGLLYIFVLEFSIPGPLLFHYADMANESSIELSYEEVRKVIIKMGFEIEVSLRIKLKKRYSRIRQYGFRCFNLGRNLS